MPNKVTSTHNINSEVLPSTVKRPPKNIWKRSDLLRGRNAVCTGNTSASIVHEQPVLSNENDQRSKLNQQVDKNTLEIQKNASDIAKIKKLQKNFTSFESLTNQRASVDKKFSAQNKRIDTLYSELGKLRVETKNNNERLNLKPDEITENESTVQRLGVDMDLLLKKDSQPKITGAHKVEINEEIFRLKAENRGLCKKVEEGIAVMQATAQESSLLRQKIDRLQEELDLTKDELGRMKYVVSDLEQRTGQIDGRHTNSVYFLRTNLPGQSESVPPGFSPVPFFQLPFPPYQQSFQAPPPGLPWQMMLPGQPGWWLRG